MSGTTTTDQARTIKLTIDDHELEVTPVEPEDGQSIDELVADWLALSYALNAMSRSLGNDDLYPFVLAPKVVEKLGFVHDLVARRDEIVPAALTA